MKYPFIMEITCLNSGNIHKELIENKLELELMLATIQDATIKTPWLMFSFRII